jgi:Pyridoxamine 5'-phosphate oxidase
MEELPDWPAGSVAVLSTAGGPPHGIPVSTCVRAGPRRALLALAPGRESLRRLRRDPHAALTFLAPGLAFTAHGSAEVVAEELPGAEDVVAVALEVDSLQDHRQATFAIEEGVRWRWTDPAASERDARVRAALLRLSH